MAYRFIPARWKTVTSGRTIELIVIHTAEARELPGTAMAVANYFKNVTRPASAHYTCDDMVVIQSVRDKDVAYGAKGANRNGLHIEHAGYARQSAAEWMDQYSQKMLNVSAKLVAEKCIEYKIPAVWRPPHELRPRLRGITSHWNCTVAFSGGKGHWDPGPHFPFKFYIDLVKEHIERIAKPRLPVKVTINGVEVPEVGGYFEDGKSWGWIRPLAYKKHGLLDGHGLPVNGSVTVRRGSIGFVLPCRLEGDVKRPKAYIPLGDLRRFNDVRVGWISGTSGGPIVPITTGL